MVCVICYNNYKLKTTLNCSHSFCVTCIREWYNMKHTCPVCRKVFTSHEITQNIVGVKTRQRTKLHRKSLVDYELNNLSKKINETFYSQEINNLTIPESCDKDINNFFKKIYNNRNLYKNCDIKTFGIGNNCCDLPWTCSICKYKKKIKKYLFSLKNIYKWKQSEEWLFKLNDVHFF